MTISSGRLEKWRNYFRTADSDIFDIIEHAIMVAASDSPKEFRLRRDGIAEKLFSCKLVKCFGCDQVELAVSCDEEDREVSGGGENEDEKFKSGVDRDGCELEVGDSKGSKVNNSRGDHDHGVINVNQVSSISFGEVEALTNEMEEESQSFGEVLRIKEFLKNNKDESDSVLFDSLRRLQLMVLSVETLKVTEIGKAVNVLQKHGSKQIRQLARTLIEEWKVIVDEWLNATAAAAEGGTPDSVNPPSTVEDEEGLPFPPLDEAAFFVNPSSMELSQFFDGMDDDGNLQKSEEFKKTNKIDRKPPPEKQNISKRKQHLSHEVSLPPKVKEGEQEKKGGQMKKPEAIMKTQTTVVKPNKPACAESVPGRPAKLSVEGNVNNETKFHKKSDKVTIFKRPSASQPDVTIKSKISDEAAIDTVKFEVSKRKLHERYQQVENCKKQRTIQVMELHDLPKHGLGQKNPSVRPGNHNRHWGNGINGRH
ncbi:unnamed protein product [Ilex paraguariensis]|uniref:TFIIS N-terminal domain-containing protein n=1 Tax=Ilex paraguariensis TaxID=185542 RepID=A0ABC8V5E1_9AQUA